MNVTHSGSGYMFQTKYALCCVVRTRCVCDAGSSLSSFRWSRGHVRISTDEDRSLTRDSKCPIRCSGFCDLDETIRWSLQPYSFCVHPHRPTVVLTTHYGHYRCFLEKNYKIRYHPSPPRGHSAVLLVTRQSSWPKTRRSPTSYRPTSRLEKTIGPHSAHLSSPLADSVWTPQVLGGIRIKDRSVLFCTFFTLFFDLDFSALQSTFSHLAQDFPFDSRHDDTHPRRVRTRRRAPHGDSVKISYPWTPTLSHPMPCGLSPAAPLKSSSFTFPSYLHWRVEYLSCTDFALRIKSPRLASSRGQATAAPFSPLISVCFFDCPTASRAC